MNSKEGIIKSSKLKSSTKNNSGSKDNSNFNYKENNMFSKYNLTSKEIEILNKLPIIVKRELEKSLKEGVIVREILNTFKNQADASQMKAIGKLINNAMINVISDEKDEFIMEDSNLSLDLDIDSEGPQNPYNLIDKKAKILSSEEDVLLEDDFDKTPSSSDILEEEEDHDYFSSYDLTSEEVKQINELPIEARTEIERALREGQILKETLRKIESNMEPDKVELIEKVLLEATINVISDDDDEYDKTESDESGEDGDSEEAEEGGDEEYKKREKHDDYSSVSTASFYIKDISKFKLLTKSEEVEFARTIRQCKEEMLKCFSQCPYLKNIISKFLASLNDGTIQIRSFVDTFFMGEPIEGEEPNATPIDAEEVTQSPKNIEYGKLLEGAIENLTKMNKEYEKLSELFGKLLLEELSYDSYKSQFDKISEYIYEIFKNIRISNQFINDIIDEIHKKQVEITSVTQKLSNYSGNKKFIAFLKADTKSLTEKNINEFYNRLKEGSSPLELELLNHQKEISCLIPYFLEISNRLKDVQEKNTVARQSLIRGNIRLVIGMALKYSNRGVHQLDLIQEGILGLVKAVDRFQYQKGFKFSTYTHWWAKQAILRAIADKRSNIRIPVHALELINRINRTVKELQNQYKRKPAKWEIAEKCNITVDRLIKCNAWSKKVSNMSEMLVMSSDNDKKTAEERIADVTSASQEKLLGGKLLHMLISMILAEATPREDRVVRSRYFKQTSSLSDGGDMFYKNNKFIYAKVSADKRLNEVYSTLMFLEEIIKVKENHIFMESSPLGKKASESPSMDKFTPEEKLEKIKSMTTAEQMTLLLEVAHKIKGRDLLFYSTKQSKDALRKLSNEFKCILMIYEAYAFHVPSKKTLEEVGRIFSITRERARQIEDQWRKTISEKHDIKIDRYCAY